MKQKSFLILSFLSLFTAGVFSFSVPSSLAVTFSSCPTVNPSGTIPCNLSGTSYRWISGNVNSCKTASDTDIVAAQRACTNITNKEWKCDNSCSCSVNYYGPNGQTNASQAGSCQSLGKGVADYCTGTCDTGCAAGYTLSGRTINQCVSFAARFIEILEDGFSRYGGAKDASGNFTGLYDFIANTNVTLNADRAATADTVPDNAITTTKIADKAITLAKIGDCPANQILKRNNIPPNVSGAAWTCAPDAGTVYTAGTGIAITGSAISSTLGTAIETGEITDGTIAAADLANNAVTYPKIPLCPTDGQILKRVGDVWACAADAGAAASQWVTSGTAISYSAGNVGIGTSVPGARLHVTGSIAFGSPLTLAAGWFGRNALVGGTSSIAGGDNSFASGRSNTAWGENSVALGLQNTTGADNAFTLGQNLRADGSGSFALGTNLRVSGQNSVGIGLNSATRPPPDISTPGTMAIMGGNVGIDTVTPTQRLEVAGNVKAAGLCLGNEPCRTTWPDGGGNSNPPVFVGSTSSTYNGNRGGYSSVKDLCNATFSGSHVCSAQEVIRSYPITLNPRPTGFFWINNGPPAYNLQNLANDCSGWQTSSSAIFGAAWVFGTETDTNYGITMPCNQSVPFACCR